MTIPCGLNDTNNGHDQPYLGRGQKISNTRRESRHLQFCPAITTFKLSSLSSAEQLHNFFPRDNLPPPSSFPHIPIMSRGTGSGLTCDPLRTIKVTLSACSSQIR